MNRIRQRLTYANVMATIAVFIALGGASYAAVKLPSNSVGTKQLKNNAVTTAKIRNGAVTGAKVDAATLGTVPSATTATSATTAGTADTAKSAITATHANAADTATSADTAKTAGHANSADTADTAATAGHADTAGTATTADIAGTAASAADAAALGGLPPQDYMNSDRFGFGTASTSDTDFSTPQQVLLLGGVEVTTNQPNSTPQEFIVRIVNRNADQWEFSTTGEPGVITLGEGQRGLLGPITTAGSMVINGRDRQEPKKAIVIQCGSDTAPDILDCFAQLSPDA
ncbi:MAG: hypothetical protein JST08_13640 [Actinobacteria bacterium]|nr:hypothetical protein [Actinomycetota bacterium]